ncbi:hypothetical protein BDL97_03G133100 [Sphagnum fallax]|nr:hypothetical protein BDL97_03G133100 [Sphagnum fallax]
MYVGVCVAVLEICSNGKELEKPKVAAAGMELAQMCRSGAAGFLSHNVPHVAVVTKLEIQLLSSVVSPRSSRGKKKGCCYRKSFCRVYNVFREDERRRSRRTGTFDHLVASGGGRGGEGGGSTSGFFSCSCEKEEDFWGSARWGNYRVGSPLWNASDSGFVVRAQEKFSDAAADSSSLSRTGSKSSERSALFYEEEYADSSWNGSGSEREPEDEGRLNGNGSLRGEEEESEGSIQRELSGTVSSTSSSPGSAADSVATGGKGPVYQVLEVYPDGDVERIEVSRRQLLRSTAGLRLRDIRSVDPALWITNSAPALLVRDQAILLNFGSLRAIATPQSVLVFDYKSVGAQAFMGALLPRLRAANNGPSPIMPFELEVVEAALISRTQRLERTLMDVEPQVLSLLKMLPNRYTVDVLEELRLGKQALVELGAKAGALRQMLLELLDHPQDIRRITIMGRVCSIRREDGSIECSIPLDKKNAEDEEQEIEMLLESYLQR